MSASSVTLHHQVSTTARYRFVDSVGFFDSNRTHAEVVNGLSAVMQEIKAVHAFLYVIKPERFTEERYQAFRRFMNEFGPDVARHTFLVVSHADLLLTSPGDQRRFLKSLREVPNGAIMLSAFEDRVVFVNSRNRSDSLTRASLLRLASSLPGSYGVEQFAAQQHSNKRKQEEKEAEEKKAADAQLAYQAALDAEAKRLREVSFLVVVRSLFLLLFGNRRPNRSHSEATAVGRLRQGTG